MVKNNLLLTVLIAISVFISLYFMQIRPQQQSVLSPIHLPSFQDRSVYIGAWVGGFWDNDTKKLDTSAMTKFEEIIGKKLAFVTLYSEWSFLANNNLLTSLNEIANNGWTPIISTNPFFFVDCPNSGKSLYATIADGGCDGFLRNMADNLRTYQKPIFLRFAWEMNLPDMYWSIHKTHSTPKEFIAAWQHMHDIFQNEKATNVRWVLSFNTSSANTVPYKQLYPGDTYVDWVAIDGYNWGNTHDWSRWTNFNGVFRNSYNELTLLTEKPVMLSEVNSSPTGTGGNKAEWLDDMLAVQIPNNFPNIDAIVFFNEDKTKGEKVDWTIHSQDDISILRKDLQKNIYKSSF